MFSLLGGEGTGAYTIGRKFWGGGWGTRGDGGNGTNIFGGSGKSTPFGLGVGDDWDGDDGVGDDGELVGVGPWLGGSAVVAEGLGALCGESAIKFLPSTPAAGKRYI